MKKQLFLTLLVLPCILFSCNKEPRTTFTEAEKAQWEAVTTPSADVVYTAEQVKERESLIEIMATKATIENNQVVPTFTRKDFKEKNLPEFYYDYMLYNIGIVNAMVATGGVGTVSLQTTMDEFGKVPQAPVVEEPVATEEVVPAAETPVEPQATK